MSFWIDTASPLKLAIASRPQGGAWLREDIHQLKHEGIDILVSLLSFPESRELELDHEKTVCSNVGISFVNFPLPDREVPPSRFAFVTFAQFLHRRATEGLKIGVHCRACIGRSSVLLATVMRLQGFTTKEAFNRISAARGLAVPDTPAQAKWVAGLAI